MKPKTIDDLFSGEEKNINYQKLQLFFNQKLKELYEKDKTIPLLDYSEIRTSAQIDLLYEIMPKLREELQIE